MARRGNGTRKRTLEILAAIPAAIKAEVSATIRAEAEAIVATQKRLVAVDDGDLRDSIRVEMGNVSIASSSVLAGTSGKRSKGSRYGGSAGGVIEGDPDLTATVIAGDKKAFYARFVEFGTAPHDLKKGGIVSSWSTITSKGKTFRKRYNRQTKLLGAPRHPGAKARPFFYGPFRARKTSIKRAVSRSIRLAVKRSVT